MNALNLKVTKNDLHFKKGIEVPEKFTAKEKEKLVKASKDFESILTSMMLKSMTKTTEGFFGKENYGGDVLDVLFETEISKFITNNKGLGIAEQIYKNISGEGYKNKMPEKGEKLLDKINLNIGEKSPIHKNGTTNTKAIDRIKEYEEIIREASKKYNVDQELIKSVILTESAGKVDAKSKANAKGLMQLMDSTASDMGVRNPWNPKENIFGGTKYLSKMLNDFDGDKELALAAYNAGPGNVRKYGGVPPFKETQNYISRVKNYLNILD